jgi:transmembrane sensor
MATNSTANDQVAARWAIRLDNGSLSDEDELALGDWLNEDERRRGALLRAEAALAYLDQARASPVLEEEAGRSHRTSGMWPSLLAAAGCLALIGVAGPWWNPSPEPIETEIGEIRQVSLADGSLAAVNTGSSIAVDLSPRRREITLEKGEAWFQVAHDKRRPFIVEAGDVRVRAVGTAFSVRHRAGGVDVLVSEGVVVGWVEGREGEAISIAAGSKSFLTEAAVAPTTRISDDVNRELAWRTGNLALNGETLAYAVSELNRYNKRKIVIGGNGLGTERLVGYFRTDRPEDFARAAAGMVQAEVSIESDTIQISR